MKKKIFKVLVSTILLLCLLPFQQTLAAVNFTWPVDSGYTVSRGIQPDHNGLDIVKSGSSVPIKASASGEVIYAQYHPGSTPEKSYGYLVAIKHTIGGETYITKYAHMRSNLQVSKGQYIAQGQVLGYMGYSGHTIPSGPDGQHLHFEILKGTTNMWDTAYCVDPYDYLGKAETPVYHKFDGTWATLKVNTADGSSQVNVFGGPGYGLKGTVPNGGSYKVYNKAIGPDGHGYFDIGNSTFILEDHVDVTPYKGTINTQYAVNIYSTPGGAYAGRVDGGSSYKIYGAQVIDGEQWYAISNLGWVKAQYLNVVK
ncbi:murein hydrolase activator EnvC family protein [Falsibacillus pallidus]|uniref:murein hydrolase activator EnvC family protein n=1 Tax=Falsibacillus pallidus TaxID=493781 RepID=UPI003D958912